MDYDEKTKVLRILDLQHPEMQKLHDTEDEITDENPAVTVIPEGMLDYILRETAKMGLNPRMGTLNSIEADIKEVEKRESEIKELTAQNHKLGEELGKYKEKEREFSLSESTRIKKDAMDKLFKIAMAEGILDETK
jgi:hypothetical protein